MSTLSAVNNTEIVRNAIYDAISDDDDTQQMRPVVRKSFKKSSLTKTNLKKEKPPTVIRSDNSIEVNFSSEAITAVGIEHARSSIAKMMIEGNKFATASKTISRSEKNPDGFRGREIRFFKPSPEGEPTLVFTCKTVELFCFRCMKCNTSDDDSEFGCSWHGTTVDNEGAESKHPTYIDGIPSTVYVMNLGERFIAPYYKSDEEGCFYGDFGPLDDKIQYKPILFTDVLADESLTSEESTTIFSGLVHRNLNVETQVKASVKAPVKAPVKVFVASEQNFPDLSSIGVAKKPVKEPTNSYVQAAGQTAGSQVPTQFGQVTEDNVKLLGEISSSDGGDDVASIAPSQSIISEHTSAVPSEIAQLKAQHERELETVQDKAMIVNLTNELARSKAENKRLRGENKRLQVHFTGMMNAQQQFPPQFMAHQQHYPPQHYPQQMHPMDCYFPQQIAPGIAPPSNDDEEEWESDVDEDV